MNIETCSKEIYSIKGLNENIHQGLGNLHSLMEISLETFIHQWKEVQKLAHQLLYEKSL